MSLAFEQIQDLFQRSTQKNSNIKYKTKWFMQKILYTFDENYRNRTHNIMNEKRMRNKPITIEDCYPNLDDMWCYKFIELYNELQLNNIIVEYYIPIGLRQCGMKDIKLKTLLGKGNNRCYKMMHSYELFPNILFEFIRKFDINGAPFFIFTKNDNEFKETSHISDYINKHLNDNYISDELSDMISNIKYVPKKIPFNVNFMNNLTIYYKPTYADFLIGYVRNWKEEILRSQHIISNVLLHICYSNDDKLDQEVYINILKTWYKFYTNESNIKCKRNICKGFNLDLLLNHV